MSPDHDVDNPEWTAEDVRAANPASDLPLANLDQFANGRRTRGPQRSPTKAQVAIRLAPDVLASFKAGGPGWHGRMEVALRKAAGL